MYVHSKYTLPEGLDGVYREEEVHVVVLCVPKLNSLPAQLHIPYSQIVLYLHNFCTLRFGSLIIIKYFGNIRITFIYRSIAI